MKNYIYDNLIYLIRRTIDGVSVSQTLLGNIATSAVFDAFDRKISETDARGNVKTFTYDLKNRLLSETDASGATTSFEYDALDRETKRIFADGTEIILAYDLRGNRISESGNATYRAEFEFDALGQKTKMRTWRAAAGTPDETLWAYDAATGNLLSKTDALGNAVTYEYSGMGLLTKRIAARGVETTYVYDAWRQLTGTVYSDGTPAITNIYNALGQLLSTSDAAGTLVKTYNAFGEVENETLGNNAIAELRDDFGRSVGYIYSKSGTAQQTTNIAYDAASGQISSAGFLHGGNAKNFAYNYLSGTRLLEKLVCPNNMSLTQAYEATRDLIVSMHYKRNTTGVVERHYAYDALGRPMTRQTARNGKRQNDSFGYNSRSELTSASLGNANFAYDFDEIGNRETASEAGTATNYSANELNQYSAVGDFVPEYDADGNATLVKTATGTWTISYNGENRPVRFECVGTQTIVEMNYDAQGRRFEKKVTVAGTITLHQRYIYRGYLQIACLDLTRAGTPALWFVFWDPTQPTATRPLAIQKDGNWFVYGHDLTKNVCEVFGPAGYIRTEYSYSPFGNVTAVGDFEQPFQWSSEFYDSELDLVYYNYRHYSPSLGRWLSCDPIEEQGGLNLYCFCKNSGIYYFDIRGGFAIAVAPIVAGGIVVGIVVAGGVATTNIEQVSVPEISIPSILKPTSVCECLLKCAIRGIVLEQSAVDSCKRADPGDCTKEQHRELQQNVDRTKGAKKCTLNDDCKTLFDKKRRWVEHAQARSKINNVCYNGGDKSHKNEEAKAWSNTGNCLSIIEKKCGPLL